MRLPESLDEAISMFETKLRADRLAPRTVHFYTETVHAVCMILQESGRPVLPQSVRPSDVGYLLDYFNEKKFAIQTRKGYLSALRKYCRMFKNPMLPKWPKFSLPHDNRPKVDWLTSDQASALLSCELTPLQSIVVHCELCLGMRHVEVIRLRAADIDYSEQTVLVWGKGHEGGKPRIIPFTSGTEEVFRRWQQHRLSLWESCKLRKPKTAVDPPNLIVWCKAGVLHPYSEEGYGLDKVVTLPLSKKLGFHFSNHTLRRTFGRALFRSGVPVATIAKILGHESTDVTLRYIGVEVDDMRDAMRRLPY